MDYSDISKQCNQHAHDAMTAARVALSTDSYKEAAPKAAEIYNRLHNGNASPQAVIRMDRKWRRYLRTRPRINVARPTHPFGATNVQRNSLPRYDTHWRIERERVIVLGDVHVPTTDWDFAARVAQVARAWDVKTLCIIGDLFNFDFLSSYAHLFPPLTFAQEKAVARELVEEWLGVFDDIWMVIGNHEDRLMRETPFGFENIQDMVTTSDRFKLSGFAHMEVTSGGEQFLLTHQKNYSKNKLKVANELALLEHMHVIAHHQHHTAIGRDHSNHYVIVDNGGLHDSRLMAYVNQKKSTSPRMNKSFVLLDGGTVHLLTPYDTMTDWRLYVPEHERKTVEFPAEKEEEQAA
jgi:hypothetical protein